MTTWEEKFIRFMAERWVFVGTDPRDFKPQVLFIAYGEDFLSPLLKGHKHHGSLYTGEIAGREIGYMRVPPGTVILEGVIRSLKFTRVDTVIGLGTCGALQPEIDCGDVVVAESARAGDCLSMHYGFEHGDVIPADAGLTATVASSLARRGLPVHKGPIVTTGAVFRETEELIRSWNRDGLLGVELEASSQFALTEYMGLRSALALLVTDSPVRNQVSDVLGGSKREAFVRGIADLIGSPELP